MLAKIRFGSSIAALALFLLPWVDIQCSEKSMGTQSGIQVIYGGGTASEEMESTNGKSETSTEENSDKSMGSAPLVALAFLAVLGAVVSSGVALFRGGLNATKLASFLPAVALILLLVQLMIGFPVEKAIFEAMSGQNNGNNELSGLGSTMAQAVMMQISVKTTTAFYMVLLALSIPTLLLINSLIDQIKKEEKGGNGFDEEAVR